MYGVRNNEVSLLLVNGRPQSSGTCRNVMNFNADAMSCLGTLRGLCNIPECDSTRSHAPVQLTQSNNSADAQAQMRGIASAFLTTAQHKPSLQLPQAASLLPCAAVRESRQCTADFLCTETCLQKTPTSFLRSQYQMQWPFPRNISALSFQVHVFMG